MWCSSVGAKHWKSWLVAFDDTLLGSEKLGTLSLAYGVFFCCVFVFAFLDQPTNYKVALLLRVMWIPSPLSPGTVFQ